MILVSTLRSFMPQAFLCVLSLLRPLRSLLRSSALLSAFALTLCFLGFASSAHAQPVFDTPTTTFTAAQPGRSFMTVGGVWDGTAEVTATSGDTFSVTYKNTGNATAYDFAPRITLPANFTRVGGIAVSATVGSPTATAAATTGTIDVTLSGSYDLPAGASITLTFGVTTTSSVASGTYQLSYNRDYSLTNLGAKVGYGTAAQQNVLVQAGDTIISITPQQQIKAVGENATFNITVTNTGLGGIFDVTLNDSLIYPSGSNLQFVSLTKTAPARSVTSSSGGSVLTLGYLAPGETFTATAIGTVLTCGSIVNNVSSVHRANASAATDSAPVQLNLLQPLVAYTPPTVALDYNTSVPVSIPITNTGFGSARVFRLQSTLNTLPLTVSNVAAGWTYAAATGLFTYTANAGVIANGAAASLTFNLEATDVCTASGAGSAYYTALYQNDCGDPYTIPVQSQSINASANAPTVALTKTVNASRIAVLEGGFYTLTLSATNIVNISTTNVTVTDVLPAQINYLSAVTGGVGHGSASYNAGTRTVTWTVPRADLTAARTLTINFAVGSDPCFAGLQPNNTASTSNLTTSRSCTLNASANASFLISNNPGLSASQFFNHTGTPTGGIYETGNADAAPLGTRGSGEGEFIPLEAGYTFGAAYPGTWAGSTYTDGFGGVTQMVLSSGSLTVTGTFGTVAVPPASVTALSPGFRIDLGFLAGAGYFNNANVAGRTVTFNYRTTAPDAAVPGITRSVTHLTTFKLANAGSGSSGGCNTPTESTFTQGAFYTIGRAQAEIALSLPSVLEICKDELLVLTVSNANAKQARNILVTLLNSGTHYAYDTTYTPVYGGAFTAGNITYTANAGLNPTFQYTGNPLAANGTIQVRVHRVANGDTIPGALTTRVNYDSWQTAAAVGRVYNSTDSYTPRVIRKANLAITVTPGSLTVIGPTVNYVTYVSNTDAGVGYGSSLTNTLPLGITIDVAATNTANAGYPVTVTGGPGGRQTLSWSLGNIAPGATIPITLHADVHSITGCAITLDPAIDRIQAKWGCDGDIYTTVTRTSPAYVFPAGKMQVVHDSTQTVAKLCDDGRVAIVVKNTGPTSIQGVEIREIMSPADGLLIFGTVQYRINGGVLKNTLLPPTGTGTSGDPYVWKKAQIPELDELVRSGVPGANQITIEIGIKSTEALAGLNPVLSASGSATISCGNAVSSPAQPFTIPIERPKVTIAKTGRNVTANGSAPFGETVYGGLNDIVEWQLIIANTGNATAENFRLSDQLSGSGGPAVINGPGLAANTLFTPGLVISLPNLVSNSSATYTITETLGGNCLTEARNADVSWGCMSNGAAVRSNVTTPGTPSDPATIVMTPDITQGAQLTQTITHLPGGRAKITVNITNNGGTAHAPVVTATIPAGSTLDTTGPVTFGGTVADITTVTRTGTNTSPIFTFTGGSAPHMLRYGETMSVSYYVRPTVFDTQFATSFTDPTGSNLVSAETTLDPTVPATANITARIDFTTSCGLAQNSTNNTSYNPLTPDLDITATTPTNSLITGTSAANYTFTISNAGEAGSLASHITADFPGLGTSWTINSITVSGATAGTGGSVATVGAAATQVGGIWTLDPSQLGTLGTSGSIVITVNAQYSGTPGSLALKLRVRGDSRSQDDSTSNGNYSLDQRGQRIVGATVAKALLSTTETDSTTTNVLVGEDVTYRISASFFGVEADLSSLVIRDTPADSASGGHTGLAYVTHALTASNQIVPTAVTVNNAAPAPITVPGSLAQSRIDFTRTTLTAADINGSVNTFEADVTVRVLNIAANTNDKALNNNLGLSFTYLGQVFRSNDGDDGFSGGTSTGGLHAATSINVRRPQLTIVKTARNVTRAGTFAATAPGQAGDVIEYRLVVSNPASNSPANQRPLYDLVVTDTVPTKFDLSAANQGADTNGSNASIETPNSTGTSGLGATITFNQTNTPIAAAGSNFDRLNPGKSITLLFRGTLAASVAPNEILSNTGTARGYSISVNGSLEGENQTAPKGIENTPTGPTRYEATSAAATVTIDSIIQDKSPIASSETGSSSPIVFIGEQVRFRITLNLPLGTVPALSASDTLPAGLALVGTPTVSIGTDIAADNEPPLYTTTNGGQTLNWNFGQALTSGASRTITIEYVTQVRNIAGNVAGTALVNDATYNFTGLPGDVVNLAQHTLTVAAPNVTVTRGVRNATRNPAGPYVGSIAAIDAIAPDTGDLIEYQISITNTSGTNVAPAYDFNIQDTLPAGLTYVDGWAGIDTSTSVTGTLAEPTKAGQVLTWGRTQAAPANLDIAPGGTLIFHYRARVDDTGRPLQNYTNATIVDWTSLDGAPGANLGDAILAPGNALGERIGTSATAPNNLYATGNTPVIARNSNLPTKVKSNDTLPRTAADVLGAVPSGFRVGDLVTYTVTIPVQEATLAAFLIRDTLPTGLAFHDTVSLSPATGSDGFTYTTPVAPGTAPAAGATGALIWNLGTVVNAGDNDITNDTLTLVYRARVVATAAPVGIAVTPGNQTLNNTATTRYTLADTSTHTSAASVAAIVARQPALTIAKDVLSPAAETINGVSGLYLRRPGDTASFRVTVTNTGTAPAYNIRVTDTLPAGLRATAPVLTAAMLNGAADLAGLTSSATWDNGTGAWVFNLTDGQLLLPTQTLVLTYTVTVDADDALRGTTLTNSAAINQFFSLPSADPEAASRRQYAAVSPVTRSLVIGLRIDGSVYHDVQPDNAKNVGEDWTGAAKPTVYANLVAPNNTVVRTVTVAPGTGLFAFDYLPPGSYTIVVTNSAAGLTASRPANWLFQFPTTGSIAATLNSVTGDLSDQDLGLNQGTFATPLVTKVKSGDTLPTTAPLEGFRIGDLVTYTVTVNPQEGALTGFGVTDVLPAGLAFDSLVSITPATGGRYTYTAPAGPAAGATGTLTWNFGAFTNAISGPVTNSTPAAIAPANQLVITYRARVRDNATGTTPAVVPIVAPAVSPASTTTPSLINSAQVGYTKPAPDAGAKAAGPATATIQVEQPRLTIAKVRTLPTPGNLVAPSGTATFQVTVTNDGTAPAYNTRITDTLPVGLRGTAPSALTVTLAGSPATVTPVWNGGTGTYQFTLSNTQLIQPGDSLVLTYTVTVDAGATRGATLTNSAVVNRYYSKAASDTDQRRQYAAVGPVTASVVVGMSVSGFVYHDLQPNNALDVGEDWTGSGEPTVFVNLIQAGVVVSSVTVAPGTGAFSFTNLPAGDYDLIVTDNATSIVATRPVNWPFQSPGTGARAFTLSNADLSAQKFGLHQGTLAAAVIAKSKAGDTLPLSAPAAGFRIGDLITYTVDIQPQEGAFTDFAVTDTLPAGLAFVATTSITQVSGPARFTYTAPVSPATAPSANDTGAVTWTFGNFDNALLGAADNTLRIVYTARVLNTGGVAAPGASPAATAASRVNSAELSYVNSALDTLTAGPATATISVEQARLTFAKTRVLPASDNVVMQGGNATFRLTATNNGTAPAYNVVLTDTLPVGMRDSAPTLVAATLNGASITGSITAPDYTAGTGAYIVSLTDTEILLPGQSLVIDYKITLDADAPQGTALTNSAVVTSFASKPSASSTERRVYSPVGPSSQSLIVGLQVAGFVYHELIPNDVKDASEDWSSGVPVFVNLVTNSAISLPGYALGANQVVRSVAVAGGTVGDTGTYLFDHVPPGSYRIIVTNTTVAVAPSAPATWTFDTPSSGSLTPVAVTTSDLTDQNLGLYQGRIVSGQVFRDLATYGTKDGGEDWTSGVALVVNLVNIYGAPVVHASAAVAVGTGQYSFTNVPPGDYRLVVAPAGQTTATTAAVPTNWVFTAPESGTRDSLVVALTDLVDQDFGLTPGRTVSGFVYNDVNPNSVKDGFEDWTTGPATVVNLVRLSTGTVFASANVPPGNGAYSFTNVPPGNFRIIVTNAPASTSVAAPATWLFRAPSDGAILINVAAANFTNQNFGLFRGRTVRGVVFRDTGESGTANDGNRQGSEPGLGNVRVRLLSAGLAVLDSTLTDGAGNFILRIPADTVDGATLHVEEQNPPGHFSTGGEPGSAGGSYNRSTDRITFSFPDDDVTGLEFGDVPDNAFISDGAQSILPGATAYYRHQYVAGTGGTVVFSTANTATPSLPWTQVIVRDLNCDGQPGAAEPVLNGVAITVTAGQEICLVLKDNSPPGTPFGAVNTTVITATFTYVNASPALPADVRTRQDITTTGASSSAGLHLVKAVDKTLAKPGEELTYTITYTNAGAEALTTLFIDDRTPHYTVFLSATADVLPAGLIAVNITAPDVGDAGSIRWTFDGTLPPGGSGIVTFTIRVQQ